MAFGFAAVNGTKVLSKVSIETEQGKRSAGERSHVDHDADIDADQDVHNFEFRSFVHCRVASMFKVYGNRLAWAMEIWYRFLWYQRTLDISY
jgi:hypothetical protein